MVKAPAMSRPKELEFESYGYGCCVVPVPNMYYRCGYIALPKGHPLFGIEYTDDSPLDSVYFESPINFSCEIDGMWVIGFDCGHYGDRPDIELVPVEERDSDIVVDWFRTFRIDGKVWHLEDVQYQLIQMAKVCRDIENGIDVTSEDYEVGV